MILGIFLILCSDYNIIYAKYILQNEFYIANVNIDRTKPKIEVLDIEDTDISKSDTSLRIYNVEIKLKFIEKKLKNIFLDKKHVNVKLGDKYISEFEFEFNEVENNDKGRIYSLRFKNLKGSGRLKIELNEGTLVDEGGLKNKFFEVETYLDVKDFENDDYYEIEFEESEEGDNSEFQEIEEVEIETDGEDLDENVEEKQE